MASSRNDYLAKPSAECCLEGSLHHGEPRGQRTLVADIDTYVARPSAERANGHILLYFPDVWGFFANGFLVMDGFADAGYLTVSLDYFRGVRRPLCLARSFVLLGRADVVYCRIRCGSIARTVMIGAIRLLTTRSGSGSISPLLMKQYLGGLRRSSQSSERRIRDTPVLGECRTMAARSAG